MSGDSFEVNIMGTDSPVIIRKSAALGDTTRVITTRIAIPTINDATPGNPSGQPANLNNDPFFYTLSDGNDNFLVSSVPIFPRRLRPPILALSGNDSIIGTNGYDNVSGMQGADTIEGLGSGDSLVGGKQSDRIDGGADDDTLSGNNDNDTLIGGDGNDILWGGKENDVLIGANGDDTLSGDRGQDILTGGPGNDTFILAGGQAAATRLADADVIVDFTAGDKIGLTEGNTFASLTFEGLFLSLNEGAGVGSIESTAIKLGTNYLGIVQGVARSELTANVFVVR